MQVLNNLYKVTNYSYYYYYYYYFVLLVGIIILCCWVSRKLTKFQDNEINVSSNGQQINLESGVHTRDPRNNLDDFGFFERYIKSYLISA